jgi:hypothetical protein
MKIGQHSIRKIILIAVTVMVIMTTIGCNAKDSSKTMAPDPGPSQNTPSTTQTTPNAALTKDEDLTKQLTSEKGVLGGQVYFQGNDYVIATLAMKKGTDKTTSQALAQKYADLLKQKYKDKKVNVQAISDGKNLANIIK